MQRTVYVCDYCKTETSPKTIGWISIDLDGNVYFQVKTPNTAFPNLGPATRFMHLPESLEFCSLNCLLEYFKSKVDGK